MGRLRTGRQGLRQEAQDQHDEGTIVSGPVQDHQDNGEPYYGQKEGPRPHQGQEILEKGGNSTGRADPRRTRNQGKARAHAHTRGVRGLGRPASYANATQDQIAGGENTSPAPATKATDAT